MKSEYKEIPASMRSNITPLSNDYFSLLFFFIQKFLFVAPKFKWKPLSEIMNYQPKFWEDVLHVCTISKEFSVIWCVHLTNQNFSMHLKLFWHQIQIKKWSKFWIIMFPVNMQTRCIKVVQMLLCLLPLVQWWTYFVDLGEVIIK